MKVITPCKVEILKGRLVRLTEPLIFEHGKIRITLHIGFTWDLADIPHFLIEEMGCPFDYIIESALHDMIYSTGIFSRSVADLYWYLILRSGGKYKDSVDKLKAKALYAGVRVGGASHYKDGNIAEAREFVSVEVK